MAGLHRFVKGKVIDEEDREFKITWKTNETDSFPEYRQTSMRELSEIAKDNKITHLRFKHDYPDKLPSDVQNTLAWLDIPAKERPAVLSDLPSLRSLTVHHDGRVFYLTKDPSQLNTQISMFKSLKKLTLKDCHRYSIPQSISKLTELEELILSGRPNYLSDDDHLSEILSSLKKLKKMDLSNCNLSAFPSSLCTLDQLEHLLIQGNKNLCEDTSLNSKLSQLKSLKTLNISNCGLKEIPSGLCTLDQLEHLLIQGNKNLCEDTSLNSKLSQLKSLKTLNISNCGLKEIPSGICTLDQLEHLLIQENKDLYEDTSLNSELSQLKSLKTLNISNCGLKEIPSGISDLTELEELILDGNRLRNDDHLGEILSSLKKLKKLDISKCGLSAFPSSISDLTELEELVFTDNSLRRDYHLNETLSSLKKLKKLDLSNCGLPAVPSSISKLTELEELVLAGNNLRYDDHLSEILSRLKKLKKLDLSRCRLSAVPSSICTLDQLEHLLIQGNKDLHKDTSLNVSQLKSLKTFHIGGCGLKEIPSGMEVLTQLTDLNMAGNDFSDDFIPWLEELRCLKIMEISGFKTLKKLPQTIVSLSKLDCEGCTALVEPPWFVCSGGLNNMKQYFKDMEAGHHSMTLSTLVVIGRKMAGKSSLVKSLTEKKKVETLRDNSAPGDETTKVFDFAQLKLTSASNHHEHAVNVVDFGGDEIYHSAYLLTFRKDCIPAVVVNMEEYEKMSQQWGPREGARRLVFEWIAHLYLACPDIGDPILVLTHMEKLKTQNYSYRDELVKTLDELLSDLKNQNAVSEKVGFFQRGFAACEICEIRHDKPYNEVYKELESIICARVEGSSVSLPNSWKEIITFIKGRETATLDYETLRHDLISIKGTGKEQLDVVLDFMQRSGEILRYQNTHMYPQSSNGGIYDDLWAGEFPRYPVYGSNNRQDYYWENSEVSGDSVHAEDGSFEEDSDDSDHSGKKEASNRDDRDDSNNGDDIYIKEDSENSEDSDDEEASDTREDYDWENNDDCGDSVLIEDGDYLSMGDMDDMVYGMTDDMDDMVYGMTDDMDDMVYGMTDDMDDMVYGMTGSRLYGNKKSLDGIIFHRVSEITKVIKLLFDHSISEYKGIVKAETLRHLLTSTSDADKNIDADTAIVLLKAFNLIHGPKSYNSNPRCYLIPQFMAHHEFPAPTGDIQLRTDMIFVGLSIPSYAYQQSTVTVLSSLPQSHTQSFPYGNGISCRVTKSPSDPLIDIHLIHEVVEQRIRLRVEGCAEVITMMWAYLLNLIRDLTSSIRDVWPASKITYELPCSHCIATNRPNPEKRTNPDFIIQASEGKLDRINYRTAQEKTKCENESVPAALRLPVRQMSDGDLKNLVEELQKLRIQRHDEVTDIQKTLDQKGVNLDQMPTLQTSLYTSPISVPKVYQMTPTRGRALIINNKDYRKVNGVEKSRLGSQHDFKNVKTMLERFGFIISRLSKDKNWTGKAIVKAIHRETQYVDKDTGSSVHEHLGMFVLVLMSHGGLGTITGCDDKSLRLKDIYGLLSSYNFPAMKGKPKLIILQACSGDERETLEMTSSAKEVASEDLPCQSLPSAISGDFDTGARSEPNDTELCPLKSEVVTDAAPSVRNRSDHVDLENSHLSVDDLLIMKPSFDDYYAFRDNDKGSCFIRPLVTAFYLYAAKKDLRTLADTIIQEAVRAESKRITLNMKRDHGQQTEGNVTQVPVTTCTFTKDRKLYLSPGVHMQTSHPDSFTKPRTTKPRRKWMRTEIKWHSMGYRNTDTPRFDVTHTTQPTSNST